jgi:hypothetical protein
MEKVKELFNKGVALVTNNPKTTLVVIAVLVILLILAG